MLKSRFPVSFLKGTLGFCLAVLLIAPVAVLWSDGDFIKDPGNGRTPLDKQSIGGASPSDGAYPQGTHLKEMAWLKKNTRAFYDRGTDFWGPEHGARSLGHVSVVDLRSDHVLILPGGKGSFYTNRSGHPLGIGADLRVDPSAPVNPKGSYYLVQLKNEGLSNDEVRGRIAKLGSVEILDYVPNNGYVLRARGKSIAALKNSSLFSYVGDYHPAYKLHPFIGKKKLLSPERAADPRLQIAVRLWTGEDAAAVRAHVERLGGTVNVVQTVNDDQTIIGATLENKQIFDLAKNPGVKWINEKEDWIDMTLVSSIQTEMGRILDPRLLNGKFIRPFTDENIDGGGVYPDPNNGACSAFNPATGDVDPACYAVQPQFVGLMDNGVSLDAAPLAHSQTSPCNSASPTCSGLATGTGTGDTHRKVEMYRKATDLDASGSTTLGEDGTASGDFLSCDAVTSGGDTHGQLVAASALGNTTGGQFGLGFTFNDIDVSNQFFTYFNDDWETNLSMDGQARGARLLFIDATTTPASGTTCATNLLSDVDPGAAVVDDVEALVFRRDLSLANGTEHARGAKIVVLPFGAPTDFNDNIFDGQGTYTGNASDIDTFLWNHRRVTVVVPVGNDGKDPASGVDIDPFDPDTDVPPVGFGPEDIQTQDLATGKNIVAVGGSVVDAFDKAAISAAGNEFVADHSSKGPATFAAATRISPLVLGPDIGADSFQDNGGGREGLFRDDLFESHAVIVSFDNEQDTAEGIEQVRNQNKFGTSLAAGHIGGAAAQVREYFSEGFYPGGIRDSGTRRPDVSGALVKAVLVASADFAGQDLIQNCTTAFCIEQGYGAAELANALPLKSYTTALRAGDLTNADGVNTDNINYNGVTFPGTGATTRPEPPANILVADELFDGGLGYGVVELGKSVSFTFKRNHGGAGLRAALAYYDAPGETVRNNLDLELQDGDSEEVTSLAGAFPFYYDATDPQFDMSGHGYCAGGVGCNLNTNTGCGNVVAGACDALAFGDPVLGIVPLDFPCDPNNGTTSNSACADITCCDPNGTTTNDCASGVTTFVPAPQPENCGFCRFGTPDASVFDPLGKNAYFRRYLGNVFALRKEYSVNAICDPNTPADPNVGSALAPASTPGVCGATVPGTCNVTAGSCQATPDPNDSPSAKSCAVGDRIEGYCDSHDPTPTLLCLRGKTGESCAMDDDCDKESSCGNNADCTVGECTTGDVTPGTCNLDSGSSNFLSCSQGDVGAPCAANSDCDLGGSCSSNGQCDIRQCASGVTTFGATCVVNSDCDESLPQNRRDRANPTELVHLDSSNDPSILGGNLIGVGANRGTGSEAFYKAVVRFEDQASVIEVGAPDTPCRVCVGACDVAASANDHVETNGNGVTAILSGVDNPGTTGVDEARCDSADTVADDILLVHQGTIGMPFALVVAGPISYGATGQSQVHFNKGAFDCSDTTLQVTIEEDDFGISNASFGTNTSLQVLDPNGVVVDRETFAGQSFTNVRSAQFRPWGSMAKFSPVRRVQFIDPAVHPPIENNGLVEVNDGYRIRACYADGGADTGGACSGGTPVGDRDVSASADVACKPLITPAYALFFLENATQQFIAGGCDLGRFSGSRGDRHLDAKERLQYQIFFANQVGTELKDLRATLTCIDPNPGCPNPCVDSGDGCSGGGSDVISILQPEQLVGRVPFGRQAAAVWDINVDENVTLLASADRIVDFRVTFKASNTDFGALLAGQSFTYRQALQSEKGRFFWNTDYPTGGQTYLDLNRNGLIERIELANGGTREEREIRKYEDWAGTPNATLATTACGGGACIPFTFDSNDGGFTSGRTADSKPGVGFPSNQGWSYGTGGGCGWQTQGSSGGAAAPKGVWHAGQTVGSFAAGCGSYFVPSNSATPDGIEFTNFFLRTPILQRPTPCASTTFIGGQIRCIDSRGLESELLVEAVAFNANEDMENRTVLTVEIDMNLDDDRPVILGDSYTYRPPFAIGGPRRTSTGARRATRFGPLLDPDGSLAGGSPTGDEVGVSRPLAAYSASDFNARPLMPWPAVDSDGNAANGFTSDTRISTGSNCGNIAAGEPCRAAGFTTQAGPNRSRRIDETAAGWPFEDFFTGRAGNRFAAELTWLVQEGANPGAAGYTVDDFMFEFSETRTVDQLSFSGGDCSVDNTANLACTASACVCTGSATSAECLGNAKIDPPGAFCTTVDDCTNVHTDGVCVSSTCTQGVVGASCSSDNECDLGKCFSGNTVLGCTNNSSVTTATGLGMDAQCDLDENDCDAIPFRLSQTTNLGASAVARPCASISFERLFTYDCASSLRVTVQDTTPSVVATITGTCTSSVCVSGAVGRACSVNADCTLRKVAVTARSAQEPLGEVFQIDETANGSGIFQGDVTISGVTDQVGYLFMDSDPGERIQLTVSYADPECDLDGDGRVGELNFLDLDGDGVLNFGADNVLQDTDDPTRTFVTGGPTNDDDNCFNAITLADTFNPAGAAQLDNDGDGDTDSADCHVDPNHNENGQCDWDDDGIGDICDNCPRTANSDQTDTDLDGVGNVCENNDIDHDGIGNNLDNCPTIYNPSQARAGGGGVGGRQKGIFCDGTGGGVADQEGDGFDAAVDNCPNEGGIMENGTGGSTPLVCPAGAGTTSNNCFYNPGQEDSDLDGIGDLCDSDDFDNDRVLNFADNCESVYNPADPAFLAQSDSDGDGQGDDRRGRDNVGACKAGNANAGARCVGVNTVANCITGTTTALCVQAPADYCDPDGQDDNRNGVPDDLPLFNTQIECNYAGGGIGGKATEVAAVGISEVILVDEGSADPICCTPTFGCPTGGDPNPFNAASITETCDGRTDAECSSPTTCGTTTPGVCDSDPNVACSITPNDPVCFIAGICLDPNATDLNAGSPWSPDFKMDPSELVNVQVTMKNNTLDNYNVLRGLTNVTIGLRANSPSVGCVVKPQTLVASLGAGGQVTTPPGALQFVISPTTGQSTPLKFNEAEFTVTVAADGIEANSPDQKFKVSTDLDQIDFGPISGGCSSTLLAAHEAPGALCEDFDTNRNGSAGIQWFRLFASGDSGDEFEQLPDSAQPCGNIVAGKCDYDPNTTISCTGVDVDSVCGGGGCGNTLPGKCDSNTSLNCEGEASSAVCPTDDILGSSVDGGPVPFGTDGQHCSSDPAIANCEVLDAFNDWHLHTPFEGCDDSYDARMGFDSQCDATAPKAHSGNRSLHMGRHLDPTTSLRDTYRMRQTSAWIMDPINVGLFSQVQFWQILKGCGHQCLALFTEGESTAGGQVHISTFNFGTNKWERWQRVSGVLNNYDGKDQENITVCEFDPGDDFLPPLNETMCGGLPQWTNQGDPFGSDTTCTTDTDTDDAENLDCGRVQPKLGPAATGCASWITDPGCGNTLENSSNPAGVGVWGRSVMDLTPFGGRLARLRWVFQGGGGWGFGQSRSLLEPEFPPEFEAKDNDDGWYIDDIVVSDLRTDPSLIVPDALEGFTTCPTVGDTNNCGKISVQLRAPTGTLACDGTSTGGDFVLFSSQASGSNSWGPGQQVALDARPSVAGDDPNTGTVEGACTAGVLEFQWSQLDDHRQLVKVLSPFSPKGAIVDAPTRDTTYRVEVRCSTDQACSKSTDVRVRVYTGDGDDLSSQLVRSTGNCAAALGDVVAESDGPPGLGILRNGLSVDFTRATNTATFSWKASPQPPGMNGYDLFGRTIVWGGLGATDDPFPGDQFTPKGSPFETSVCFASQALVGTTPGNAATTRTFNSTTAAPSGTGQARLFMLGHSSLNGAAKDPLGHRPPVSNRAGTLIAAADACN